MSSALLLLSFALVFSAEPSMYAIQNWGVCRIPAVAPGDPCTSYQSAWRLVSVDSTSGEISDLSGWKDNKFSSGNNYRATASIRGIGYSEGSEQRDQLTISVGTKEDEVSVWDLNKKKFSSTPVFTATTIFAENQGFFITASTDDVLPLNKVSLYDSMNMRYPSHFAEIDTSPNIGPRIRIALDMGNSEVTQHVYVAASGSSAPQLYKAHRATGNVTELPLNLTGVENASVEDMFVNPITGELIILEFSGNIYKENQKYSLREYTQDTGELGHSMADMTDLAGTACRAFDPVSKVLSFGCNPVHLFELGAHNATSVQVINISTTVPATKLGGSITIGSVAMWSPGK